MYVPKNIYERMPALTGRLAPSLLSLEKFERSGESDGRDREITPM
ncbi:hypothetical protein HMPREF3036_00154 [Sutterella sp. KLE1602]|nr:hypothetical protein HMPREF3036_00154 [Sutterella sp. KLE1602]